MTLRERDDRTAHLLTRGNVDGIVSAALFLAKDPGTRVTFVPSGDLAVDVMRRDIASRIFHLVDLGLTPRLAKTIRDKGKLGQRVAFLDHHEQSHDAWPELQLQAEGHVEQGISAAAVAYQYLGLNGLHKKLVAVADLVEYCPTPLLDEVAADVGRRRVEEEARMLDFAWRYRVDDDAFRYQTARRLAAGKWPSEVPEVRSRYHEMLADRRWDMALERVRERIEIKHNVALLRFGRHRTSLFGFGSRALSEVARELGAHVAVLLNKRSNHSSMSLRRTRDDPDGHDLDLGRFVGEFTAEHGVVGGGHAHSAGAKIPTKAVPQFLREVHCFA